MKDRNYREALEVLELLTDNQLREITGVMRFMIAKRTGVIDGVNQASLGEIGSGLSLFVPCVTVTIDLSNG